MSVTLGIDIGTSGTKTLAIDETGHDPRLGLGRVPLRASRSRAGRSRTPSSGGRRRRRPSARSLAQGGLAAGRRAGRRPERPDARLGLPRRRRQGDPPRPALERPAHRRRVRRDRGESRGPRGAGADGRQPRLDRLHRAQAPLGPQRTSRQTWERVRQVLLPKDYIRYRLSGTYATEVSDASGTLLLDVANRRWSQELLGKLDLDPALLAPLLREPRGLGEGERHRGEGDGAGAGHADRRRRRRPAGRRRGQRHRAAGRGLGHDGHLGRRLRARRRSSGSTPSAAFSAAATRCRARGTSWASSSSAGGSFQWFRNELGKAEVDAAPGSRASIPTTCSPARPRWPARAPRVCSSCPI